MRFKQFAVSLAALLCCGAAPDPTPIRHVFLIVLENEGYDVTFGAASKAPYLARTLSGQGALLQQYFGTGHASLDNYLAMISGQAATPESRADCGIFADFKLTGMTADGQAIGHGCVYPASVKTLADQLKQAGLSWKGYMEDMGNDPAREAASCGHPALNGPDRTHTAEGRTAAAPAGDQYASRHDPFVYFHSILDTPDCTANVVRLDLLSADLQTAATTPNFSFITPNLCHDGHDEPCKTGDEPGGLASADAFLKQWVPLITASPAFREDGLLIVTFDESDDQSAVRKPNGGLRITYTGDSCCGQQPGPNLGSFPETVEAGNETLVFRDFGGDRIGAVLLSPAIKPGTISTVPYNHYSLLKSLEDLFHLDGHLGYAGQAGLAGFGSDVFTADRR
jgi:hypothetical protein